MSKNLPDPTPMRRSRAYLAILNICPIIIILLVFRESFNPAKVLFANDGPLGALVTQSLKMPDAFGGMWGDSYWLGTDGGRATLSFTYLLLWVLGPVWFAKFYVPGALVILHLCARHFFKRCGFSPEVMVLGGLAAALNSNYFSNSCWGLATRSLSLAAIFLALAAVQGSSSGRPLIKAALAGLAIGLAIIEGGDNGAIFSLFVAAFAFFWNIWCRQGSVVIRVLKGGATVAIMAVLAAVLAAQTLNVFFGFSGSGTGIAGLSQKGMTPEQKWSFATQWSLPKAESLRVVVPGLYGYRLDTPGGGNYWGKVGQDAAYETTKQGFPRHSGAGEYAGVLVVLVALWALAHSFMKGGAFTDRERRMIWFWGVAAFIALLLSWGRHAPFYQFIYALPYFSTIRNPMKFMHPCHMALMILFAYGLQGMWRRYLEPVTAGAAKAKAVVAQVFEKRWMIGSGVAVAVAVVGFLVFASSRTALARHIGDAGFEPEQAVEMARFSAREVGWSVFFLFASVVAVLMISYRKLSVTQAVVVLAVILTWDLWRANQPWIQYYDYKDKYASNPVLEVLAAKPYEGRTTMALSMCILPQEIEALQKVYNFTQAWMGIQQIFGVEWLQHQFPYYNIQALDQPQEPRMAADKQAYRDALMGRVARLYELTNTRFIVGTGGNFAEALNQVFDPQKRRFRAHTPFNLFFRNPEARTIGARAEANGPFALLEFTGALPRAKLFTQWQTSTNEQSTLDKLADPAFDPHQVVLVADSIPSPGAVTNAAPGTVEIVSYAPKRVELKANATAPSVLLLNDRFDPGWKVSVDGNAAPVLRANFLMRGVQVPAGQHTVVFSYQPASKVFYISLGATLLGLALCGFVWWDGRRNRNQTKT